jgi:L-2-hydroxyglutarate oxidase
MFRSWSKATFARSLQALVPEVQAEDLIPAKSGVRAQALRRDGSMVEDFLLVEGKNALHVCNAPSPAATASLEIAKKIVSKLPRPGRLSLVKMA